MLWIRTQDGKRLINAEAVECFYMWRQSDGKWLILCDFTTDSTTLGTYDTDVQAKEVLDDIHRWIAESGQGVYRLWQPS